MYNCYFYFVGTLFLQGFFLHAVKSGTHEKLCVKFFSWPK